MFQKKSSLFIFIALILIALYGYTADTSILEARSPNQTIPTRTPVPEPTEDNSGGGNSGSNNGGNSGGSNSGGSSNPTETPVSAQPTSTPTLVVTIGPTPIGGYISPETCGPPYFVSVQGGANVRQGPETSFEALVLSSTTRIVLLMSLLERFTCTK